MINFVLELFAIPPSPGFIERLSLQISLFRNVSIIFIVVVIALSAFIIIKKKFVKLILAIIIIMLVASAFSYFKYQDLLQNGGMPPECSEPGISC